MTDVHIYIQPTCPKAIALHCLKAVNSYFGVPTARVDYFKDDQGEGFLIKGTNKDFIAMYEDVCANLTRPPANTKQDPAILPVFHRIAEDST